MIQTIYNSTEKNPISIYCILPIDTQKISFILGCEIVDLLMKKHGRRDKVILFSGDSEVSELIEDSNELINKFKREIPIGKVIATYLKSTTLSFPKLLFSIRKSKPSWLTAKHIFASVICCSKLSNKDIEEIISWSRDNSIPTIILLENSLLNQRAEWLSEQGFYILGFEKSEIGSSNNLANFFSSALNSHDVVKTLKTKSVSIPGQIQHRFDNFRSILKQITADTQNKEAEYTMYLLRILLKKLESSPCKIYLSEKYFTEQGYDISVETILSRVERLVESYDGLGKSSMYLCISNVKQIISEFSESNPPKFSQLLNEINTAIGMKESLLVLFSSKAQIKGFYESIRQTNQFLDEQKLFNEKIFFTDPFSLSQGIMCHRVVIVSDYPHSAILKAFLGIESISSVLLHYPGESITIAMDLEGSYEFSKKYFNHKERQKVIERIENNLPPDRIFISKRRPHDEETLLRNGKTPLMPVINVNNNFESYKVQSNQDSTKYAQSRAIKVTFSDGKVTYVTENSTIKVLLTNGTVETKRAIYLMAGDQVISFRDSIVSNMYSAIRDELKNWDPKTLRNFILVETWKGQLKKLMEDQKITTEEMVKILSAQGSKIQGAETIRNWTIDLDKGGIIGPQDTANLDRLVSLFPKYFGKIPLEELHRAVSWVRGLPNRLISLSQKVILAKEFGEQHETDEELLLYDVGKGLELKIVSLTSFLED